MNSTKRIPKGQLKGVVKTVNSVAPDVDGNVVIPSDLGANNAGTLSAPTITITGSGSTFNASSVEAVLYPLPNWQGTYNKYTVPSATDLTLTDNSANYLIVNYNGGSPIYSVTTNVMLINGSDVVGATLLWREGTQVHFQTINWGLATASRVNRRLVQTNRYERANGLSLGETTGSIITLSAGVVWYGVNEISELATTSASSNADFYYHVSGVWTKSTVSTYNNLQYDNGTNLVTLGGGKFAVNWVYRYLDGDGLPKLAYILGGGDYSQAAAIASLVPTPPPILSTMAILVGRIIVQKNATTAFQIDSAFTQTFASTQVTNHNDLANLQGGTANEYFHLTNSEYTGTGTGNFVRATSPVLVTPNLGTPSSLVLANATGLPNSGLVNSSITINGTPIALGGSVSVGTVTSVAALTLGTSGTDLSSTVANGSTTPVITLNVPTASATNRGALSASDWTTFNNKQNALTLTVTGNSGSATLVGSTLNIPTYTLSGLGGQTQLNGTGFVKANGTTISYDNSTYLTTISGIAAGGELSGTYPNPTVLNSAVIGKVLTGLNLTGGGTIASTDTILQAFGKVQNQISGLLGGVNYQGVWNASTNSPTLTSSVGTKGYYYVVSVAGSTNLNGITDWKVGDWAIFNGSTWDKVDNTDAVSSVNGFTGAVSLTTANISEVTNLYYTDARARAAISLTTTGASGSSTYNSTTGVLNIPTYTLSGLGATTFGLNLITFANPNTTSYIRINSDNTISALGAVSFRTAIGAGTITSVGLTSTTSGITIGSSPITTSGNITLDIATASSSQNGLLSSTDFTTFNNKIAGSGTTNYLSKFTASGTIGNSAVFESGGNVGIGNSMPASFDETGRRLVIGSGVGTEGMSIYSGTASNGFLLFADGITGDAPYKGGLGYNHAVDALIFVGNGAERLRITSSGNVGIGTTAPSEKLTVSGNVLATAYFTSSDMRLKELVEDNLVVKGIENISAKSYIKNGKLEVGYFAQEFKGVLDTAVVSGADGMLSLSYQEIHTAKIASLEARVKQLEAQLNIN